MWEILMIKWKGKLTMKHKLSSFRKDTHSKKKCLQLLPYGSSSEPVNKNKKQDEYLFISLNNLMHIQFQNADHNYCNHKYIFVN